MLRDDRDWGQDLGLRAAGLFLLAIATVALRVLFHRSPVAPSHVVTAAQAGLAATGFLGVSFGAPLVVLGAHLFDQVELSERWRRRPAPPERTDANA